MTSFNLSQINDEGQHEMLPAEGYIAAATVLFLIGFFGFSLNLFVMIFMWSEKQLWTPLNMILFNLVLSDFLVSIFGNPWTFTAAVSHRWIFGVKICIMYGFLMSLLGIVSITTLTVLAFERYLMIARPLRSNVLNYRTAGVLILAIWMYSLSLTIPPLFGWGEYTNESANISCSINWEEKSTNSMSYILYLFAFGLFIPLLIISFSYTEILLSMRRNAFRMGQVSKAESKVAYMIFLMIIAFLTAWSPYAILALIIQFGDASFVTPGMSVFPALLAKSSICYNPIIYIGLNAQFQQTWRQVCRKKRSKNCYTCESSTVPQEATVETRAKPKDFETDTTKV